MSALKERALTRKTSTGRELAGSLLVHGLILGGILGSGLIFHSRTEKWGDSEELAGAVQATAVTAIPLPPRVPPKEENVLAKREIKLFIGFYCYCKFLL